MILDNRQVVPDIIVSRDGVPNNSIIYNINVNNNPNAAENTSAGNYSNRDSPRHVYKPKPREAHKYPMYATGNNNGSPRHVPHNGNFYSDINEKRSTTFGWNPNDSPTRQRILMHDSPLHRPKQSERSNNHALNNDSPTHPSSQKWHQTRISDERRFQRDKGCITSPRHQSVEYLSRSNSPRRMSSGSNIISNDIKINTGAFMQSPKKVPLMSNRSQTCNELGSPRKPTFCSKNLDVSGPALGSSPLHKKNNLGPFRPRSSSHPCEIIASSNSRSKIPVQTKVRNKLAAKGEQLKRSILSNPLFHGTKSSIPDKNLSRKLSMPLPSENISKGIQETNNLHGNIQSRQYSCEYNSNLSPKRLNVSRRQSGREKYSPYSKDWREHSPKKGSGIINRNKQKSSFEYREGDAQRWNWRKCNWKGTNGCDSWNIENDKSVEENDLVNTQEYVKHRSKASEVHHNIRMESLSDFSDEILRVETSSQEISSDSGIERESSTGSKMVLIKCKDASYLTKIYVNDDGIQSLRVVGRVGVSGCAQDYVMNGDQSEAAIGDLNSNHSLCSDDVIKCSDVMHRDALSENTTSLISQGTDTEFEHDTADYQWLLDYEYRESYCRDSMGCGREQNSRTSVLQTSQESPEFCYDTLSRNIDANLAEIDMDDFRSEDIHQLLSLPNMCGELQDTSESEMFESGSHGSFSDRNDSSSQSNHSGRCVHHQEQLRLHQHLLRQRQLQEDGRQATEYAKACDQKVSEVEDETHEVRGEEEEEELEEFSGVSGELSLYQSGPLFSPLKEPPLVPPSFSVDSLDSDSIHEDLILTCQANKDNYTIAFEGSLVQFSEDSDYHIGSDTTGSGSWSTERLEGRSPAPNMTHSDQPYTTWSRVSRRSSQSQTPDPSHMSPVRVPVNSPAPDKVHCKATLRASKYQQSQEEESKSNSMPNLMRRSLMKRSLDASGQCVKVYDLQNSLRSSHLSNARSADGNNFSLVRMFIKQKSLSKEAVSMSSSFTDPSQEGACSSSGVNDSSDWPMNSQSENDMDGSASPVPSPGFTNQLVLHSRGYRGRGTSPNIMALNPDSSATLTTTDSSPTNILTEGPLNCNNNNNALTRPVDNVTSQQPASVVDNIGSFEDSLKEALPCSKAPMTSPIREEPEGMDISIDSRCENKVHLDQSEKEIKRTDPLQRARDNKWLAGQKVCIPNNATSNKNIQNYKNIHSSFSETRQRAQSPGTPKKCPPNKEASFQRRRQDSGNSSSGYASNVGSKEKLRSSDCDRLSFINDTPKPKPRSLKQIDQCLQTSNLKVSATVNTSGIIDKKDVYVYYPNYALPDLGFLKEKKYNVDARIFLVPQHYISNHPEEGKCPKEGSSRRPVSCGDMEKLRKQGFSHVKDWDSLNFLLPKELKEMLMDDTECMETAKPSFCQTKMRRKSSNNQSTSGRRHSQGAESKASVTSNSTHPSSGYRGSSTFLNDSDAEIGSSSDMRFVYKYENGIMDGDGQDPPPLPKRSISLPVEDRVPPTVQSHEPTETPPPRPPLPRGILRKCTSLKDYRSGVSSGSKRHSAGDATKASMREDLLKRRSLQETVDLQEVLEKTSQLEPPEKSPTASMRCSCVSHCTGFCGKGLKKKNLLQVNELPEVSSHEELSEEHLVRLRNQVSNFLVAKGSQAGAILIDDSKCSTCDCPRKSVSFAEGVCNHQLLKREGGKDTGLTGDCQHKPECVRQNASSGEIKLQKQAISEDDDFPPMLYDAYDKKTLVLSVRAAVEKLLLHFNHLQSQNDRSKSGPCQHGPEVAQLVLDKLCPAIYALLSDGLLPSLHSLFGKITNSVWKVVEATSQLGPSTKALNDLVMTLNSEECLSEGPIKFNAFIFGLLNLRSIDAWLSYLRTRETSLQKHYHPEGFLYLANTAMRHLYDDLILALRPLAVLPFQLDLLYEYKALHASLLKMEERLIMQVSQRECPAVDRPLPSSSSGNTLDQILAAKESKDFRNVAAQQDRVRTLMRVLTSPEGEVRDHSRERSKSPRPRSCFEDAGNDDINPALKKRWSGVQLGSKLITALDKFMIEELGDGNSSSDYTDSLDNPRRRSSAADRSSTCSDDGATEMRISDISSRDDDISERSATDKDTENEKGIRNKFQDGKESEGEKFRRLQLKWEQMTIRPTRRPQTIDHQDLVDPSNYDEKAVRTDRPNQLERVTDKSISPGCVTRSKIPRPVSMTSPQRPFKAFEPTKERHSPQQKPPKRLPSPSDGKGMPKPAPRRSLKDRILPSEHNEHSIRTTGVRSKTGVRSSLSTGSAGVNRASSVPGRNMERATSFTRYESQRRGWVPRSASQGRRQARPDPNRLVQTLHHRMATDNGHLSFNRGDILAVVVDVDDRYLLCCLNDRKGLVPRNSVVYYQQ